MKKHAGSGQGRPAGRSAQWHAQVMGAYQQGRYAQALELCVKSWLPLDGKDAQALSMAGILSYLLGHWESAKNYQTRLLALPLAATWRADTLTNRALSWTALHQPAAAEADYRASLHLNPQQAKAWGNLGNLLVKRPADRLEALACYERALAIQPDYVHAWTNLGFAREQVEDWPGAEAAYQKALTLHPRHMPALNNYADLLERLRRPAEALEMVRRALAVDPDSLKTVQQGLDLRRQLADWTPDAALSVERLVRLLAAPAQGQTATPLLLMAYPEVPPATLRETARHFARQRWMDELAAAPIATRALPAAPGRLRVGYLSADFRNHAVSHLITEVIEHHDRVQLEVFLYAYGPVVEDDCRQTLRKAADHFVELSQLDDRAAAQRIHADAIDILVDLTGFTTHARLGITALKPAPVTASWIGFVGTLGEPGLADYVIGDPVVMPAASVADFSEHQALLPHCFQPNAAWAPVPLTSTRAEQGLPEEAVVFCSFNQTFKFTPQMWDNWCAILRAVPGSVLWLPRPKWEAAVQNLQRESSQRGVDPGRLVFAPRVDLAAHRGRIALADLALDTSPYNSGTTASDALRCGVPLVTLSGATFASRMAASLLHGLDLPDLITTCETDYVALATRLGQDPDARRSLRERLAQALPVSQVFRPAETAGQVERLYRQMYAQAVEGKHRRIVLIPD